jgi:hypothetical protein
MELHPAMPILWGMGSVLLQPGTARFLILLFHHINVESKVGELEQSPKCVSQ